MECGDSAIERGDDLGPDVRIMDVVELLPSECACVVDCGFDVRGNAPFVDRPEISPDECGFEPVEERVGRSELATVWALETVIRPGDETDAVTDAVIAKRTRRRAVGLSSFVVWFITTWHREEKGR
jgi:hypothetical protein